MRPKWLVRAGLLLAVGLLLVGAALAAGYELQRHVVGGGGGRSTAGSMVLNATIGETLAGGEMSSAGGDLQLASGFWGGGVSPEEEGGVFLPLLFEN